MAELTVHIASHHFTVTRITPRGRPAVDSFARKYIQWGWERAPSGRSIRVPTKVFAAATTDRSEYRFHINQYKKFLEHLEYHYLTPNLVDTIVLPLYEPAKVVYEIFPHWVDREHQPPVIEYMLKPDQPRAFVSLQTGKGKAQPLDAKIKIPGGWKTMGEIKVGDLVVAHDGFSTPVTGVFPQGEKEIFKVTFSDGRSTECCAEHLWEVFYINTEPHKRWRIIDTREMMRLISMPNPRVYVRLVKPEKTPPVDLPIDPYVFGCLLGDGHIGKETLNFSTADTFILEEIKQALPEDLTINYHSKYDYGIVRTGRYPNKNSYLEVFRSFGLDGKLSHEKFIPEIYLNGSALQKRFLLQGLLDTDGTVQKSGSISFNTSSLRLAENVQYLIRSLGGLAAIRQRSCSFTYNGVKKNGRTCYDVDIRYAFPETLVRLPRKIERINAAQNQYANILKLRVMKIESVGVKEAQCISIHQHDQLYVTDDFIVTHNTYCSLRAAQVLAQRSLAFIPPKYMDNWLRDIPKTYSNVGPENILTINGSGALQALLAMAEDGNLDEAKFIIVSTKTMQNWISLYEKFKDEILQLGYACLPDQLCEKLQIGVRIIDEVHEAFHLNFKIDLYTHVPRSISLSATLVSDDDFMNNMYELAYPASERFQGGAYHKYINSTAIFYNARYPNKLRTRLKGSKNYSHHAFEDSVMRHPDMMENYLKLIKKVIDESYIAKYKPGAKILVFCAGVEFATRLTAYLKQQYSHLDVRRYVEDDPYSNLMEADMSVSTLLSAGTGVDVPNLSHVLLTTAVKSSQSNIQGFGRLRELKDGTTPHFLYLVCEDISKHIEYHERKKAILMERALKYWSVSLGIRL